MKEELDKERAKPKEPASWKIEKELLEKQLSIDRKSVV